MKLISYLLLVPRIGVNAWKYTFVLPVLCLIRLGFEESQVKNIHFKTSENSVYPSFTDIPVHNT
jgi:hypothetical protein